METINCPRCASVMVLERFDEEVIDGSLASHHAANCHNCKLSLFDDDVIELMSEE